MAERVGIEPTLEAFLSLLMVAFLCQVLLLQIRGIGSKSNHYVESRGSGEQENLCQAVFDPTAVPELCLVLNLCQNCV